MKLIYFIPFFLSLSFFAKGQDTIDSLLYELSGAQDNLKVKIFNHLGREYLNRDVKKTIYYGEQAEELSEQLEAKSLLAESKSLLGKAYYQIASYPKALKYYLDAYKLFESEGLLKQGANILNSIGIMYVRQGTNEKSLEYDEALKYFLQSLDIRENLNLTKEIGYSYNSIAVVYKRKGQLKKALDFYFKSLDIFEKLNDPRPIALRLNNISALLSEQGKYEEGLDYYFRAFKVLNDLDDKENTTIILNNIAYNFQKMKNYNKAIEYSKMSLNQAEKLGAVDDIKEAYATLSETYSLKKDFENAYKYHKLYSVIKDSLFNIQNVQQFTELNNRFQLETKDKENQLLKKENEKRALQNSALSVLSILVLIILIMVLFTVRKVKKKNALLAKKNNLIVRQNTQLNELNEEKSNIIGVISHDLRNSLNKVFGFVYLMDYGDNEVSEEQKEYLEQMRHVNKEMSDMINNILDIKNIEEKGLKIEFKPIDIEAFFNKLLEGHRVQADRKKIVIKFENKYPEKDVLLDSQSFSRIIDNLLSNAIKFSAFGKTVTVVISQNIDRFKVEVIDEGPGLTEHDKKNLFKRFQKLSAMPTDGESTTGLGLTIVKSLAEKLNGNIFCESELGKGTNFIVELPNKIETKTLENTI